MVFKKSSIFSIFLYVLLKSGVLSYRSIAYPALCPGRKKASFGLSASPSQWLPSFYSTAWQSVRAGPGTAGAIKAALRKHKEAGGIERRRKQNRNRKQRRRGHGNGKQGFKKGIPLGFYISQWLANYLLEPLDHFITDKLGIPNLIRYMDDIVLGHDNKKKLHQAIVEIKKFIGRRFRLKLKRNYQVFKFNYQKKNGKVVGRVIDFMGFLFFRNRTTMRKAIMLSATRLASKLHAAKEAGRGYFKKHLEVS